MAELPGRLSARFRGTHIVDDPCARERCEQPRPDHCAAEGIPDNHDFSHGLALHDVEQTNRIEGTVVGWDDGTSSPKDAADREPLCSPVDERWRRKAHATPEV